MLVESNSSNADALLPITSKEFVRYTIDDYISFGINAVGHVTGLVPLASIQPTPAAVQTGLDDLITKNGAAKNGGRVERLARNASHKSSIGQVRQWANYIDFMADGDISMIVEAGFQPRRASTPSQVAAIPANVRAAYNDMTGEMLLRCKGGRNVRNFSIQYAESADGPWIDLPLTTKARGTVVSGLTPGKMYWFRMKANGAKGSSDWSVPTCKMAI
jgi:hypothetical protein